MSNHYLPIAITGIGCRYPGFISSADAFWQMLINKTDTTSDITSTGYHNKKVGSKEVEAQSIQQKQGEFINDNTQEFDSFFFNLPPGACEAIPLQERILPEVCYEALEDAGITIEAIKNCKCGIFIGQSSANTTSGSVLHDLTDSISYFFDLKGPSLFFDTACSSPLVAVHHACQSIWNGESDMAWVGGANYISDLGAHTLTNKGQILSNNSQCETFDSDADGYAWGVGVVVLKKLDEALKDKDKIYATIVGTGNSKSPIGSVEKNLGHLETGTDLAGLIKAAVCMYHNTVTPDVLFNTPNDTPDCEKSNHSVPESLEMIPESIDSLAIVNALGPGGTNAHLVLKQYHSPKAENNDIQIKNDHFIFPVSAKGTSALKEMVVAFRQHILENKARFEEILSNAIYRKSFFPQRLAVFATSPDDLVQKLEAFEKETPLKGIHHDTILTATPKLVFVYTGVGAEWWKMGREMMETEPVFYNAVHDCDIEFKAIAGWSVYEELMQPQERSRLHEPHIAQPACLFIQVALTKLLGYYGISPDAVVGHSLGETAAAHAAGALSLRDAIWVNYHRVTVLLERPCPGSMLAAALSEQEATALIQRYHDVSIAAINSPKLITLSGGSASIKEVMEKIKSNGGNCRLLDVTTGFHSPVVDVVKDKVLTNLADIKGRVATINLYSTVTGTKIVGDEMDNLHWWKNGREPILFAKAIESIVQDGYATFIEIGPQPIMKSPMQQCVQNSKNFHFLETLNKSGGEKVSFYNNIAKLFTLGYPIKWDRWIEKTAYRPLPAYPWQKVNVQGRTKKNVANKTTGTSSLFLNTRVTDSSPMCYFELTDILYPLLSDYVVPGKILFPATGYFSVAIAIYLSEVSRKLPLQLEKIEFNGFLPVNDHDTRELFMHFDPRNGQYSLQYRTDVSQDIWTAFSTGRISSGNLAMRADVLHLTDLLTDFKTSLSEAEIYQKLHQFNGKRETYSGCIKEIKTKDKALIARLTPQPDMMGHAKNYFIHPTLLDACLQTIIIFHGEDIAPVSMGKADCYSLPDGEIICYATLKYANENSIIADIIICNETGEICMRIEGLQYKRVSREIADSTEGLSRGKKDLRSSLATPYVAPGSDMEEQLVKIWEALLEYAPIGTEDDFFQLGGNSLSMMKLITRIHQSLGVQIDVAKAFQHSTITDQALLVTASPKTEFAPIPKAPVKINYPQSGIQKRMFILDQMNPGMISYNEPVFFMVEGNIDINACENAFREIINRHEALRTSFHILHDVPVQKIHDYVPFSIEVIKNESTDIDSLTSYFIQNFDLSAPPLLRVGIKQLKEDAAYLLIDMHHIITDGESYRNLFQEFITLYGNHEPEPLQIQYKDYTEWQHNREVENRFDVQKNFWLDQFKSTPEVLNLPTDFIRPQFNNFNGTTEVFYLPTRLSNQLKEICGRQGVTMYTLLLTALNILFSKLSGVEDITLGTSAAGRQHADAEKLIGAFIKTLPIRNYPDGEKSFAEFLTTVKDNVLKCFDNQDYSYEQLIGELNVKQDLSHNPLFDIMFEYYSHKLSTFELKNIRLSQIEYTRTSSKLDLSFRAFERESDYMFYLDYRTDLYKKETIQKFISYFINILERVEINIHTKLRDINILSPEEVEVLRTSYNPPSLPYLRNSNLVTLFEHEVSLHPDSIAVSDGKKQLTYSQLNEESNKVANYLIGEGIMPGNIVGLLFERSLDMVICIWGVLKAGGAYLPIDPTLPEQRISYMLNHSGSAFLLSQGKFLEMHAAYLPTQAIDSARIAAQSSTNASIAIQPIDLAYCIFTSGSSGKPKGVMMNHRSVINLVKGLEQEVYSSYGSRVLNVALLASFSFDASVQQIYGALLLGHSLYICNDESRRDGEKLRTFFEANGIDVSDGTPTHLRLLTDVLSSKTPIGNLSTWILAGEALPKEWVKEFYHKADNKVQLYNFYGPTETCVDSTSYKVDRACVDDYPFIPIGKPLPNERVYITDAYGNLTPPGVVGELCIAGDGLAQRYVGDEGATSEKFRSDWIDGEEKIYRTGDMAKWLPDGNLEYRGRLDSQIKLRGYRIELLEIENQLSTHPEINHCAVDLRTSHSDKFLVAYYVAAFELQAADLRQYLAQSLPDYMIPSYFMRLDQLPLTTNGKIDRNALPAYKITITSDYTPPSNEAEQKLVEIWAEVLKLDAKTIGVTDNFFDLGGQSLKLVFLANRVKETFKVSLSLMQLTSLKNIQELAKEINGGIKRDYIKIQPAQQSDFYPLSYAQQQFYVLHQLNKDSIVYNQPQAFLITGRIDTQQIEETFHRLIAHHDIFRTCFKLSNDAPVQCILNDVSFALDYYEASPEKIQETILQFTRPFDLSTAPLLRAGLVQITDQKHLLLIDRHHIISDGIGLDIFLRDFKLLYQGQALPEAQLQYKDYAVWQQREIYQQNLQVQKRYWENVFAVHPEALALRTDYDRPAVTSFQGDKIDFDIDLTHTQHLYHLTKSLGITTYSLFLGMLKILLYKLTSQKDIVVGTPVSGRRSTEVENIIGVFINVLAIRNKVEGKNTVHDFLKAVHQSVVHGLEYQDYPYEKLVVDLGIARNINRNPLFDVMFVYGGEQDTAFTLQDATFESYALHPNTSQMDLMLHVNVADDKVHLSFQYSTDLFHHSTIENFVRYFKQIITQSIIDTPIEAIHLLGIEDGKLIRQFNNSEISFDISGNIVDMFEKQALAYPNRNAVVYDGESLTYEELNTRSNQLAGHLVHHGVAKGDIVGLMVNRSADIIIGILGVLKSGAAYLPIDHALPYERIRYMLEASHSKILLGHYPHVAVYEHIISVQDINTPLLATYNPANLNITREGTDITYCIFTSGSTGTPKGVLIEDGNIINLAEGLSRTVYADLEAPLRVGLIASYSFDASCQQIYITLLKGHCLYICKEEERMDGESLYNFYKDNRISVSDGTPTHFGMFLRNLKGGINLPDFKAWLLAGETLPKELVSAFYEYPGAHSITLWNMYGPTETCVDSTYFKIDPAKLHEYKTIPIGRPLPNERIYIVDEYGNSVPMGVIGELWIAGAGLARGYLANGAENEKFMQNRINGEDKIYKTGDAAYWLPDGNIAYHGRIDNQIKLRGYRIEPGEIEQVLLSYTGISASTVSIKNINGEEYLTAYYISDENLNAEALRTHMSHSLPEYMVPSFYVQLSKMPLTPNGKLDRAALPVPNRVSTSLYIGPSSDTESKLVEIWAEVLDMDTQAISINRSFLQLGGNSLMAVQIANKIKRTFNFDIKLVELFKKTTIEQQANFIDSSLWISADDLAPKAGTVEINI
jgi:amino acid adenylation domain-containing protein